MYVCLKIRFLSHNIEKKAYVLKSESYSNNEHGLKYFFAFCRCVGVKCFKRFWCINFERKCHIKLVNNISPKPRDYIISNMGVPIHHIYIYTFINP